MNDLFSFTPIFYLNFYKKKLYLVHFLIKYSGMVLSPSFNFIHYISFHSIIHDQAQHIMKRQCNVYFTIITVSAIRMKSHRQLLEYPVAGELSPTHKKYYYLSYKSKVGSTFSPAIQNYKGCVKSRFCWSSPKVILDDI